MSITLELPSTAGFRKIVHVDNASFSDVHVFEVGPVKLMLLHYCNCIKIVWHLCHTCSFPALFKDTVEWQIITDSEDRVDICVQIM
jgi:hypothetical protein